MQCESVDGRRLPDVHGRDDETGLWDKPPGTWRWRLGGWKGARVLEAVLPSRYPDGPGKVKDHLMCHCLVEGPSEKWIGKPIWAWDGNEEEPTLSPSILVDALWGEDSVRVFWHGYMEKGNLRACE